MKKDLIFSVLAIFIFMDNSLKIEAKNTDDIGKKILEVSRKYQDFPKKGVFFQDLFPVYENPNILHLIVDHLAARYQGKINAIVGLDARGFILGGILAYKLSVPFVPVRKSGKLPGPCFSESYLKEYGLDQFELSKQAFRGGEQVLIIDDLIATGGSASAAINLIRKAGAIPYEFFAISAVKELDGCGALAVPCYIFMGGN